MFLSLHTALVSIFRGVRLIWQSLGHLHSGATLPRVLLLHTHACFSLWISYPLSIYHCSCHVYQYKHFAFLFCILHISILTSRDDTNPAESQSSPFRTTLSRVLYIYSCMFFFTMNISSSISLSSFSSYLSVQEFCILSGSDWSPLLVAMVLMCVGISSGACWIHLNGLMVMKQDLGYTMLNLWRWIESPSCLQHGIETSSARSSSAYKQQIQLSFIL